MKRKVHKLKATDFFCSGGGMTYGMRQAGIEVIAGIDNDPTVKATYEKNNPGCVFLLKDIFEYHPTDLEQDLNIKRNDDNMIFIGCSPCQYWSIIRTDKKKAEKSKDLLKEFHRFVKYFKPGFVVIENVPGLERKAEESGLKEFVDDLEKWGYTVHYQIYKLNEYGVPQTRKRFSLIASRIVKSKIKPEKSNYCPTVRDFIGGNNRLMEIKAGYKEKNNIRFHSCASLSDENLKAIMKSLPGKPPAKKRKKFKGKGFRDSYGRMSWDKPAPTITTKFFSLSNGRFGHPEENRAISIREGALLQTFPFDYIFINNDESQTSMQIAAKIIGNAVPPEFAKRIGEAIKKAVKNEK